MGDPAEGNSKGAGQRQLFIDDYIVEETYRVKRSLHQPTKYAGNPVLISTDPWEERVNIYGTVMYEPEQELYRMWYTGYGGRSGGLANSYTACYATSRDGIFWEKPALGAVQYGGSKDNNIFLEDAAVLNVIRDAREEDPAKLYKSLFYENGNRSASVAFSPDGTTWTKYPGNPVLDDVSDTHTLLGWDEAHRQYVAYIRPLYPQGRRLRVIGRSVSDDFIQWTAPETVMEPDDLDPSGLEFYGMSVFKYEGLYLGTAWAYHAYPEEMPEDPPTNWVLPYRISATVDVQLAASRDGIAWERIGDRRPFIPLGPPGSADQGCLYTAKEPLVMGDELWFYYGAWDGDHGQRKRVANICLAKLRLDGFVSMDADADGGTLLTKPFRCEGGRLTINADAGGGAVLVAVLDEGGVEVLGYRRTDSGVIDGDSIRHRVSWSGARPRRAAADSPLAGGGVSLDSLKGRTIRLKFYIKSARLYSFTVG